MNEEVTGRAAFKVNGRLILSEPNATLTLGARRSVRSAESTTLACAVSERVLSRGAIDAFCINKELQVVFDADNGMIWRLRGAVCKEAHAIPSEIFSAESPPMRSGPGTRLYINAESCEEL